MEQEKIIYIGKRKINDLRTPDPGYKEVDILFCPIDIIKRGETILGKVGYTDQRSNGDYCNSLKKLVYRQKGPLTLETISIDEAAELGMAHKFASVNIP